MSVFRVKHQRDYVVIHKGALENPNLSFKAKGLWAYCMSRPDDWHFHISHLKTVSKEGEDAIYSAVKELISEGYCHRMQPNKGKGEGNGRGCFQSMDYFIYETQQPVNSNNLSQTDFPDAVNPPPSNPALLSIDSNQVLITKHVCKSAGGDPPFDVENSPLCDEKEEALEVVKEILDLPSRIEKLHPDGVTKVTCILTEVFLTSLNLKKDWTTKEIHEAWRALHTTTSRVSDAMRYISGVITQIRNVKKAKHLKKKELECQPQQKNLTSTPTTSENFKETSSETSMKQQPSQKSLWQMMEEAGLCHGLSPTLA